MTRDSISYSEKYVDDKYEYRHVMLPADVAELVPRNHLMTETEWRNLGVQQSPLWVHYMVHNPEPHVLLFRRNLSIQVSTENFLENNDPEFNNPENNDREFNDPENNDPENNNPENNDPEDNNPENN